MIESFADNDTRLLFEDGVSRKLPKDIQRRALRRLLFIDFAEALTDLYTPTSNKLHALQGKRKGQYAIRINDQWRICFKFDDGRAYDVEICDYH